MGTAVQGGRQIGVDYIRLKTGVTFRGKDATLVISTWVSAGSGHGGQDRHGGAKRGILARWALMAALGKPPKKQLPSQQG